MSKYLLLRSNKQSGPYTLEEIRAMQLKAYDLVWVDGKSAAWRYPGEIEELKSFAPLVEEQPFDRFFKKPVPEEQSPHLVRQASLETETHHYAASSQQPAIKHGAVYINLPADKKESQQEREKEEYTEKKLPARERVIIWDSVKADATQKERSFAQSLPAIREGSMALEEDLSQSSDETRKQYAEKILRQKKNKPVQLKRSLQPIAIGLMVLTLLAAGIMIGLTINGRGTNSPTKQLSGNQNGASDQQIAYPTKTIPVSSSSPASQLDKPADNPIDQAAVNHSALVNSEKRAADTKKNRQSGQPTVDSLRASQVVLPKADSSTQTQREASHRAVTSPDKDNIKNNIEDYVSLGASKYNVGTFGGISDLQLTVDNSSPYALDLVVVEVQYIQSNKKTFKTETMYFRNINAGSALMQEAPKSPRGVKIKYRITMINAKSAGISYSDI